ncbi:copper resistance protein CopC [Deinococcus sp. Arct2-2]|uniref:copper resistance CopC family protein n=1 Tax=Deinococcus sp. Arct2-2 TaxID=2568653 RepID=UPI0010A591A7|nr:copper resistance CopC family protein [Deinococcus sp. Arct2-2]THF70023.1 copper resistance protein CopC [Deinococcus sp. Arct2-2]
MNRLLALSFSAALSTASAHTVVTVVSPTPALPVSAPKAVLLRFGEPVNLRFATFRVLPMPLGKTPAEVTKLALGLKPDSPQLVNTGPVPSGMAAKLSLPLKANLKAGPYLIAWAVLSDDGHPVTGQSLFRVR